MKYLVTYTLLLVSLFSANAFAHEGHCEDTNLGAMMAKMKKIEKSLKKAVRSEDYEDIAEYAAELKDYSAKASQEQPLKYKDRDAEFAELKEKYIQAYKDMDKALDHLIAAKTEAELESAMDALKKANKQGHKGFKKDCD